MEGYSIKMVFSLSGPNIRGANAIPSNPLPHSTSPGSLSDDFLNVILDSFWPSILLLLTRSVDRASHWRSLILTKYLITKAGILKNLDLSFKSDDYINFILEKLWSSIIKGSDNLTI